MHDRREAALALLANYLPSATGDARFKEVAQDYGGMGTTCGYLTGWLLWRLGCVDNRIVNRTDKARGLRYFVGENISRLVNGGKALGAWRTVEKHGLPKPGDLAYYANDPPKIETDKAGNQIKNFHEHVNVVVEARADAWRTGDAGRTVGAGVQGAEFVNRAAHQISGGKVTLDYFGGPRRCIGYVDLEAVPIAAPPWDVSVGGVPGTAPGGGGSSAPPSGGGPSAGEVVGACLLLLAAVELLK